MKPYGYAVEFMQRVGMPAGAEAAVTDVCRRLYADGEARLSFERLKRRYLYICCSYRRIHPGIRSLAKKLGVHEYTLALTFFILCLDVMKNRYEARDISDEIFYDTFSDLKYKAVECKNVKNIWGTFVAWWYDGFFRMTRFAYGRFQYETTRFLGLRYKKHGVTLNKRSRVVNFHIPSSGKLTYEKRLESYRLAYEKYSELFGGGPVVFVCSSWLLYRQHYDFLPADSNILDFMNDFDIVYSISLPRFQDGWRVFGADAGLPADRLPERTSLQRAYKKRLLSGKPAGAGYGVIVFDGKNILTRKTQ